MNLPQNACDLAKMRYLSALTWVRLWNILLYVFGVSVVLFLVTAIILFIRSTWLPGALTSLGTIVSGTGIAWVVNQRTTAHNEEKDAFQDVERVCSTPGRGIEKIKQELSTYLSRVRKSIGFRNSSPWGGFGDK